MIFVAIRTRLAQCRVYNVSKFNCSFWSICFPDYMWRRLVAVTTISRYRVVDLRISTIHEFVVITDVSASEDQIYRTEIFHIMPILTSEYRWSLFGFARRFLLAIFLQQNFVGCSNSQWKKWWRVGYRFLLPALDNILILTQ